MTFILLFSTSKSMMQIFMNTLLQKCYISSGYPFRGKIEESNESNIKVVQMKDVSLDKPINWSECLTVELNGRRTPDYLRSGDILFVARGNRNYAVQIDEIPDGIQAVASPHFFVIRLQDSSVTPEFLTWFLNQTPCQQYFEQNAEGTMAKSIRRSVLEQTPIAIPSLQKQAAIVKLHKSHIQHNYVIQQLLANSNQMMSAIATDLMK